MQYKDENFMRYHENLGYRLIAWRYALLTLHTIIPTDNRFMIPQEEIHITL